MEFGRKIKGAASRYFQKRQFARNVGVLALYSAIGQGVAFAVSPILTRFYSPGDFGVYGVYASLLSIFLVVASLRYEYAIPLPEEDGFAANILVLCFLILGLVASLCALFIQGFGEEVSAWANVSALSPYWWLIPLGVFGAGSYQILTYWALRTRDFPRLARTRLTRGLVRALFQTTLGAFLSGPFGLLFGHFLGESAGTTSLAIAAWRRDKEGFTKVSFEALRQAAVRYRRFPLLSSSADLLESVATQMPQILMASFYGATCAGWFALAQRVVGSPLNTVVDSVAQVYFGEAARLPKERLSKLFLKLVSRLLLIGGLPVLFACILAPYLFPTVFGERWSEAGTYLQVMGIMFAVRFAVAPLFHTLTVLERQDMYLSWQVLRFVLVLGGFVLVRMAEASHVEAVFAYTLAMTISYLLLGVMTFMALSRQGKVS